MKNLLVAIVLSFSVSMLSGCSTIQGQLHISKAECEKLVDVLQDLVDIETGIPISGLPSGCVDLVPDDAQVDTTIRTKPAP